ncbi:MAG: hypothetical protein MJK04_20510, partial [Psychrosphaera sp.]|nr:hypothetical protein [Psychrosphaera sp.]
MSVVCGVIKNGQVAISCDTQTSFGSIVVSAQYHKNCDKLFSVNGSVMGMVGWNAINDIMEHLMKHDKKLFKLSNRMEIFDTLLKLHNKMKEDYFIETS